MGNDKAMLRRYEDDLNVSGTGLIVMGVWGALKVLVLIFLGEDAVFKIETEDPTERLLTIIVAVTVISIILALIILLHVYIGRNAIRASKGLKHNKGYIVVIAIMLVLTVLSFLSYKDMFEDDENTDTSIASFLVDLTTVYIYVAVLRSTYMIKKIKEKQMQE